MFIYHFNQLIRRRILWVFFTFIIAIAFISTKSFSTTRREQSAGHLNGKAVSAQSFDVVARAVRGFGANRDHATPPSAVEREVWEQLAARQSVEACGMPSSHNEVRAALREVPAFQGPNGFDYNRYRMVLAENRMDPATYEEVTAHQLAVLKASQLTEAANWVPPMELEDELASLTDKFTVRVAAVSNQFAVGDIKLEDGEYRSYYEEHKGDFALPERVSVRYVAVPVTNYLPFVTVSDDDLRDYYDSHADSYTRTVTNDVTEPIPFDEVRGEILAELNLEEAAYCAGTAITFTVYGKLSVDADSTLAKLAGIERAEVKTTPLFGAEEPLQWTDDAAAFAETAFELDKERADMRFGIVKGKEVVHVLELVERVPAHTPPYDEVLDLIKPQAERKARDDAFSGTLAEKRADILEAMKKGKGFAEAASSLALNVSTSLTYAVNDVHTQKFEDSFTVAYGARECKAGEVSEPIPVNADKALLVYVEAREPGEALSVEMMRSQIRSGIGQQRSRDLFTSWMKWNLARKKFNPTRPIAGEDDDEWREDGGGEMEE